MWAVVSAWALKTLAEIGAKALGIAVAILGILAYFFYKRRQYVKQGEENVKKKVKEHTDKVNEEWKKIDNSPNTPRDALNRLRKPPSQR